MSARASSTPNRKDRPAVGAFVEGAVQCERIEVEAIDITRRLDGKTFCEVCQPDAPPAMFSVYLRSKTEDGGLARCIADFSHPQDAVQWAQELGRQAALSVDVRFDLQKINALPIEVGENVIVGVDVFSALCGRVVTIDDAGRAVLADCYDLFGPLTVPAGPVSVRSCRRFWEEPRLLGLRDLASALAA